ncbi:serine dehydratase subunit alpha family protein [Treponema sp. OMZ 840]|uniref:L-cysteine desulfidase family protein n=1 Tax=Treponema sp. OMZ 840 TaxID=244313 RepID=UPI003D94B575
MNKRIYEAYVAILETELVPALGCTEPIAIAFAAAKVRDILGTFPEKIQVDASGNIIKNVQSVTVPNSGGLKGIDIAATLGIIGGNPNNNLEVLADITDEQIKKAKQLVAKDFCKCTLIEGKDNLYIRITAVDKSDRAVVVVSKNHTNISYAEKNGKVLIDERIHEKTTGTDQNTNKELLCIKNIIEFVDEVNLEDVRVVIERQIQYNTAISKEGLTHGYGAQVGRTIKKLYDSRDVRVRARAAAAAGSDARMSGCAMPVVINSGSGNQGMTVSLPVIEYAKAWKAPHDKLIRALVLANLIALLQKRYIGNLSAFCGVVCAAVGAGCGITYLYGGDEAAITRTITNTLANIGGIVCDGAKPSCAAKIASALDAAILGFELGVREGIVFKNGEGLVKKDAEDTIRSFGRVGKNGMRSTDIEILNIMLEK